MKKNPFNKITGKPLTDQEAREMRVQLTSLLLMIRKKSDFMINNIRKLDRDQFMQICQTIAACAEIADEDYNNLF